MLINRNPFIVIFTLVLLLLFACGDPVERTVNKSAEWRSQFPMQIGTSFSDCKTCPEMMIIGPGNFMMGSQVINNKPIHRVYIEYPFAIAKYEVTVREWDACIKAKVCSGEKRTTHYISPDSAVNDLSRADAKAYLAWLNSRTGASYRLPTSAEWEYAARAGTQTNFSWGNEVGSGNANCNGCGSEWDERFAAPVGSFTANNFGLYDMHGNANEHVEDCWRSTYSGQPIDGSAYQKNGCRSFVIRSGNFESIPMFIQSGVRQEYIKKHSYLRVGLRPARDLIPSSAKQ